jgi:hypothetical protein
LPGDGEKRSATRRHNRGRICPKVAREDAQGLIRERQFRLNPAKLSSGEAGPAPHSLWDIQGVEIAIESVHPYVDVVPPVALRDLTLRIDIDEDVPVAPKIFT